MIKKLTAGFVVSTALASTAMASAKIYGGATSVDSGYLGSGTGFSVGFMADNSKTQKDGKGFYLGFGFEINSASLDETNVLHFEPNMKLGYTAIKDLNIYAIGTLAGQTYSKYEAFGFGYGAGVSYDFFKGFGLSLEYKNNLMRPNVRTYSVGQLDYHYETTALNLTYKF